MLASKITSITASIFKSTYAHCFSKQQHRHVDMDPLIRALLLEIIPLTSALILKRFTFSGQDCAHISQGQHMVAREVDSFALCRCSSLCSNKRDRHPISQKSGSLFWVWECLSPGFWASHQSTCWPPDSSSSHPGGCFLHPQAASALTDCLESKRNISNPQPCCMGKKMWK